MKMKNGARAAAALIMVLALLPGPAGAVEGRGAPVIQDLTQLTPAPLHGEQLVFRACCTDPDGDGIRESLLILDGIALQMAENDPADIDTTDGKLFSLNWSAKGGSHIYAFAFSDGTDWTNTTLHEFEVLWAPPSGDWEVREELSVANATIELRGNLLVRSGGTLELSNTTIKINGDVDGRYGVLVERGASLALRNGSKVTKSTGAKAYTFRVMPGGTLRVIDSEIWYAGYENPSDNSAMGIFVEGDTTIEHSTIVSGAKGIIAENCDLVMRNTTLKEAFRRNVEATNASITMEDCLVYSSRDACNVEFFRGTKSFISRCTIQKNGHNGIWMRDGARATVTGCLITDSNQNGIWMDNGCELTVSDTVIETSRENGLWVNGSSTVTATNITIRNCLMNGTWVSGGRITMIGSRIEGNELHGFAAFDGCEVTFRSNFVNNSRRHNYETTNCTTLMEDCVFGPSMDACNVEFFAYSKATVRRTTITGAGHNCFWFRDYAEITIEDCNLSASPNNVIWCDVGCRLTVRNSTLSGVPLDGINCSNSTVTVEGCTIKDCGGLGINSVNCSLSVTGCTFSGNTMGQVLARSYLSVRVLDPRGRPISGASVKITDQERREVFSGKTGDDGTTGAPLLLTGYRIDNDGKRTDFSYTIKATKGDYEGTLKTVLATGKGVELRVKEKPKPGPGFELVGLLAALVVAAALAGGRLRGGE
ncbi:MAG: right-handed parallel beta-helix repeat-containing protein [Thermoplasmata archaeon]